ncbi:MAG: NUDIX hydrolase [bacterium]|nr:NUDIX hydrolase [bacterium]
MSEESLSSRLIYSGRIMEVRVDEVRLTNGKLSTRELVRVADAVLMLPLLDDGTVLLISQYRKGPEVDLLELPAGKIDPGEDPLAAAHRELLEETGYRAGKMERLSGVYTCPGFCDELIHLYLATELHRERPQPDDDELIRLVPTPLGEVERMLFDGRLVDSKSVAALGLFLLRRGCKTGKA